MARNIRGRGEGAGGAPRGDGTSDNPNQGMETIVERSGTEEMSKAPLRGGSYGVIPEAEQRVHIGAVVADRKQEVVGKPARRFVLERDFSFMYNGVRTQATAGKVFLDTAYDIAFLQRQGMPLREEVEVVPTPEPEPATEEVANA